MPVQTLMAATPLEIHKTFDKVWVEEIVIAAPDPNADARAIVRLRLFRDGESGRELWPERHEFVVEGIMAAAEHDPALDSAVTAIMAYVAKIAADSNIAANPEI